MYVVDAKSGALASMRVAGCLPAVSLLCRHGHLGFVLKNNTIITEIVNNLRTGTFVPIKVAGRVGAYHSSSARSLAQIQRPYLAGEGLACGTRGCDGSCRS